MYFVSDKRILANDANFYASYETREIDWEGNKRHDCWFQTYFYIYKYQTCYSYHNDGTDPSKWHVVYLYRRPLEVFSLIRIIPTADYYFNGTGLGQALFVVRFNGNIEKL